MKGKTLAAGLVIGVALGVGIGVGVHNVPVWTGIGVAFGIGLAAVLELANRKKSS
jgi:uncharacterized membrane protein YgaE (UPF0421/DUF939 family)